MVISPLGLRHRISLFSLTLVPLISGCPLPSVIPLIRLAVSVFWKWKGVCVLNICKGLWREGERDEEGYEKGLITNITGLYLEFFPS